MILSLVVLILTKPWMMSDVFAYTCADLVLPRVALLVWHIILAMDLLGAGVVPPVSSRTSKFRGSFVVYAITFLSLNR